MQRDRLPFVTVCARLEESGYRRDQIGALSWWFIKRVMFHPRDDRGQVKVQVPSPVPKDWTHEKQVRRILIRLNCPTHLVEPTVQQILAAQEAKRQAQSQQANRRGKGKR